MGQHFGQGQPSTEETWRRGPYGEPWDLDLGDQTHMSIGARQVKERTGLVGGVDRTWSLCPAERWPS